MNAGEMNGAYPGAAEREAERSARWTAYAKTATPAADIQREAERMQGHPRNNPAKAEPLTDGSLCDHPGCSEEGDHYPALDMSLCPKHRDQYTAPAEPAQPKPAPAENKLPAGVHLSIAVASSIGSCTSTGVVLLRNNPVADPGVAADTGTPELDKPGILMVVNNEFAAASRCFIHERQATSEKTLITRVPAELTKVGKTSRTAKFASGGDETLFGRSRVWVVDSDDSQTAKIYNPLQEVPSLPPAAFKELDGEELIIEIPLNVLAKMAEAINGVSNQDGAKVRLAIPSSLEDITLVSVIGSDGIAVIQCTIPEEGDRPAYIKKFNDTVRDVHAMFEQLPESLRKLEKTSEDEDGSLSKAYIAPGQEITKAEREPWQAEYELTPVMSLELPETLKKLLVTRAMETIGHLQAVAQAHPNTHFTEIDGVGAGKADKIGEAMRKVWNALKAKNTATIEMTLVE